MGLTTKKADTPDTPEVTALKVKLVEAGTRLCHEHGMCGTAVSILFEPRYGLNLDPSLKPVFSDYTVTATVTVAGREFPTTKTVQAYSQEGAALVYIRQTQGEKPLNMTVDNEPEVDTSDDTDEVKAYKATILAFAKRMKDDGSININPLNKMLKFLGIEQIPVRRRFHFDVPVVPPAPIVITYWGEGFTQEEAWAAAQDAIAKDNARLASGRARGYAYDNPGPLTWPLADDPTMVQSERFKTEILG